MSEVRTQSVINRSAVKDYALKVAAEKRAGKFTRVGESFLDAVEAEVESAIRQISSEHGPDFEKPVESDGREFITGAALVKVREKLDAKAQAIIAGKVRRHPSVGCTLKD